MSPYSEHNQLISEAIARIAQACTVEAAELLRDLSVPGPGAVINPCTVLPVISVDTGEILDYQIMSKHCTLCS